MNLRNLRARYEKYGLGRIFEEIKNYAKNAVEISLKASDDQQIPIGASKFEGPLDLPRNEPWTKLENRRAASFYSADKF